MTDLIIVALIAAVTIALILLTRRQMYGPSVRRAFGKLPVTSLGDITMPGRYRLSGVAVAIDDPPVSEASGRPFVARDMRIHEHGTGDSGSLRPARQVIDFILNDGTGRALVRGADATVAIDRNFEMPQTTLDQVPWADELLRAGGYYNGSPSTCKIRVYEGVLQPGATAGVVGYVEVADREARRLGAQYVVRAEGQSPVAVRPEQESDT
jgi:hypothetical protein